MLYRAQVNSNLVGSACLDTQFQKRKLRESFAHLTRGVGFPCQRGSRTHLDAVNPVTSDGRLDFPAILPKLSVDQRQIFLRYGAQLELARQTQVAEVVFRDDQ